MILDGSNSYDADCDILAYSWLLETKPNGSYSQLSNSDSVKLTLSIDVDGEYILKLVVNDGTDDSIGDTVIITANTENSAPIANAGLDMNVNTYQSVSLNGSNSSDANGDTLSYQWSFASKPNGSSSVLNNSNTELTDFTPDIDGQYTISLVVNDGQVFSNSDNVVITSTTANSTPIANAGNDQVQFDLN